MESDKSNSSLPSAASLAATEQQQLKRQYNKLEDEKARKLLNDYYQTEYFNYISTKYSPAPYTMSTDPATRRQQTREMERVGLPRESGEKEIKVPVERFGSKRAQRPWEPHIPDYKPRTGTYVGYQPDLCPLKLPYHERDWDNSTEIKREHPIDKLQLDSGPCEFWHCKLPRLRGECPYKKEVR